MDKKQIKKQIEQIKKEVYEKLEYTIYWFKINCKKTKILAKGNSKTETRKKIKEIAENNKLEYAIILRVIVHVHKKLIFDTSTISFNIDTFQILDGNLKKITIKKKTGFLWLRKDWLLENGWDNQYIFNAIDIIKTGKDDIIIPGINYFDLLGKN